MSQGENIDNRKRKNGNSDDEEEEAGEDNEEEKEKKQQAKRMKKKKKKKKSEEKEEEVVTGNGLMLFSPTFLKSQGVLPPSSSSSSSSSSSLVTSASSSTSDNSKRLPITTTDDDDDTDSVRENSKEGEDINPNVSIDQLGNQSPRVMSFLFISGASDEMISGVKTSPIALVSCDSPSSLFLSGVCYITLLQGNLILNGYKLPLGRRTEAISPVWSPALHLEANISSLSRNLSSLGKKHFNNLCREIEHVKDVRSKLTQYVNAKGERLCSSNSCLFLVEAVDISQCQNWMLKAEDYNKYLLKYNEALSNSCHTASMQYASRIHLESMLICDENSLEQCGIDKTVYPQDWIKSAEKICKDIEKCPRVLVCGAKGVGKSTCLRYVINNILSRKSPCVALLDCDVGQSECNISGIVSLHILSDPLISPSHLRLRKPELSFFIGDITPKGDPATYQEAVSQLYSHYELLKDAFMESGDVEALRQMSYNQSKRSEAKSKKENAFQALDDMPFSRNPLPLVVNCDGWIKSIGLENLSAIVSITNPTHVVHICTEKNKDLPALNSLKMPLEMIETAEGTSAVDTMEEGKAAMIFDIKPVRRSASNIAPVDLRNLRLVAYFLENCEYLNSLDYSMSSSSSDNMLSRKSVLIRGGALVDHGGLLPIALRQYHSVHAMSFADTGFQIIGPCVAPRLVLAAFNLALVGLVTGKSRRPCRIRIPSHVVQHLKFPHVPSARSGDSDSICFDLDCSGPGRGELQPCLAVGIVADVDLLRQCAHVIVPSDKCPPLQAAVTPQSITAQQENTYSLQRSKMQVPSMLVYSMSSCVATPYMFSESRGEGSGTTAGSRTNMKRRCQQ